MNNNNSTSKHSNEDIVLLVGAGASSYLGLPTLDDLLRQARLNFDALESADTIREIRNAIEASPNRFRTAVFEELIARLRYYLAVSDTLFKDYCFRQELGFLPSNIENGTFGRKWKDALTTCYRVLLEEYGPNKIDPASAEFQTTLTLLEELAKLNSDNLHIYTTNYDCSFQVLAANGENISFLSKIDNQTGSFTQQWYKMNPKIDKPDLPRAFVHRLHGCVAWFEHDSIPYRTAELYGAGNKLLVHDYEFLHKMCVKLVAAETFGSNPVFSLAFDEFSAHLRSAKILLVWGYSFRDLEVLRIINNSFSTRKTPLVIHYLDPYLTETVAINNIQWSMRGAPITIAPEFKPRKINWNPFDGHNKLISKAVSTLKESLN